MKIYTLSPDYFPPFARLGVGVTSADSKLTGIDMVLFPGGPDVPPSRYGEKPHYNTHYNENQYKYFDEVYDVAVKRGIPMVGVCGGGQYLCTKAGGKLIQDVSNHAIGGTHPIITTNGERIMVTSTHHQMMNPFGTTHLLIAWAESLSDRYRNGDDEDDTTGLENVLPGGGYKEPDVIHFPEINSLSIQYHPEYMSKNSRGFEYASELVEHYLL